MNPLPCRTLLAACSLLAGCAINVNPPLLFGDHTTYGLHLGNDPASAGGAVTLGYKARSIAVVPVSVLQPDGSTAAIRSKDNGNPAAPDSDALSVFAVFENAANTPEGTKIAQQTVRLGQIFATGIAAQELTRGYRCRSAPNSPPCTTPQPAPATGAPATTPSAAPAAGVAVAVAAPPVAPAAAAGSERPYQSPLVFVRTDVVGIDIGGSLAQQGLRFALGADFDNVALIPPATQDGRGRMTDLYARGAGSTHSDVLSVLGQFNSATATQGLNLGLERYFATGLAARNLAAGLGTAIAKSPAPTASASTPASAPTQ